MYGKWTKIYRIAAALISVIIMCALAAGFIMSRTEQPDYKVIASDNSIELREYPAIIIAQAEVDGARKAAIEQGFRLIAAYIFGANNPNAKIAMTVPVQQQRSQTIAMTAPVNKQTGGDHWVVSFIMPRKWTLETLPVPNDQRVTLKPVVAKSMVAIRFSGTVNDNLIRTKTEALHDYASTHKLTLIGEPVYAFYNSPWSFPFLRRNEIMFEITSDYKNH